jgi:hypothetical protein
MTILAGSAGGAIAIAVVLLVIFLGTAYGLSRRGSGVHPHPREDREADQRDDA